MNRRTWLAMSLAGGLACRRKRGMGFPGYAFVANEDGQAIAAVDLTAFAVVRHIRLDSNPTQVIARPGRPFVYALTPANAGVHEISVEKLALSRRAALGAAALGMHLSPQGDSAWTLCRQPRQLAGLHLDSFKRTSAIALPGEPRDFDLHPEQPLAALTLADPPMVVLADLANGSIAQRIPFKTELGAIRFRKDGRQILVGATGDRMLTILETSSGRTVVHLPLSIKPEHFCFKQDGGQLFLTGEGVDAVAVVYPYSTQVAETVLAGHTPGAMACSANPDYLLLANEESGEVTIMNIETRRVLSVAPVGTGPGFIAVTPDNQYALVLNRRSGDLAVLRIATAARRSRFPAGLFTMIPVGSKPVSAAVVGL